MKRLLFHCVFPVIREAGKIGSVGVGSEWGERE